MRTHWLDTATGHALLEEESRQVAGAFENIFGDQFLQIGAWGDPGIFRRHARTRRYAVVAARPDAGVDFVSLPEDLAVPTDSIDAVFLPHLLETTRDPHAVLREVDRILRPDGHVVVAGFNAWGWWGLRHYLSGRRFPQGGVRLVSEYRLRDWLNLLDYYVEPPLFHHMTAPLYRAYGPGKREGKYSGDDGNSAVPEVRPRNPRSCRWNPLASCYLLVARKEVFTITQIRPAFRRRKQLVGGLVNPTTRNAA